MSKQSLISDEIDVDRKTNNNNNTKKPLSPTTSNGNNNGSVSGAAASSSSSDYVEQTTTEAPPPNYTGMPEYENPRATLRLSTIRETTQDFFFEPFDPNHPDASSILKCLCKISIIEQILTNYGFKAVAALSSVYFCVKGIASATTGLAYFPLLKRGFHVSDPAQQQQLGFIAQMAWPMKPLVGLISDNFPIYGYRKRVYLCFFAGFAMVSLLSIFLIPADHEYSVQLVTFFLFCVNLCYAGADLLCESAYSRFMILNREGGTAIISWVWGMFLVAGMISAALVGPLADAGEPKVTMIILIPFILIAFVLLGLK